jgi:uncharacterized protein YjcR
MEACPDRSGSWPARNLHNAQRFDIDWIAIEHDYRAGQLSLRDMASKHGCSHSAIANRASRHHWIRAQAVGIAAQPAGSDLHQIMAARTGA